MFTRTKNRKAISVVLTTLIILVASVVLGTGVVLYGTSLFQTGAQSASFTAQGIHVWANSTSTPTYVWGASELRNSGDKILSVDTISVRGNQVPFSNWYYENNQTAVTSTNIQSQLNYTGTTATGMMKAYGVKPSNCAVSATQFYINEFGGTSTTNPTMCFKQATGPISLKPGDRAVVYFQIPTGVLSTVDAGSQSSVAMYAGNVGAPQSITVESK